MVISEVAKRKLKLKSHKTSCKRQKYCPIAIKLSKLARFDGSPSEVRSVTKPIWVGVIFTVGPIIFAGRSHAEVYIRCKDCPRPKKRTSKFAVFRRQWRDYFCSSSKFYPSFRGRTWLTVQCWCFYNSLYLIPLTQLASSPNSNTNFNYITYSIGNCVVTSGCRLFSIGTKIKF